MLSAGLSNIVFGGKNLGLVWLVLGGHVGLHGLLDLCRRFVYLDQVVWHGLEIGRFSSFFLLALDLHFLTC